MSNNPFTLDYSVHATPLRPGQSRLSFHVRHEQRHVVHTRELQRKVARDGIMTQGTFVMAIETLKEELACQLLTGHDVHIDGLCRFALQLHTRRPADSYGHADEVTANEVAVGGATFIPDKSMLHGLQSASCSLRRSGSYRQVVPRDQLVSVLTDYCRHHGWFTRRTVQVLFALSRYKASLLLATLCTEEQSPFVRYKQGTTWVYLLSQHTV